MDSTDTRTPKEKFPIIEYLDVHNLDSDITVRFKKKSFKMDGRVAMVVMGIASLLDGLVLILSLGFLQSHFEESLLWNIYHY